MSEFSKHYHGALERCRQLYESEALTSWQIAPIEKHIEAMETAHNTEIERLKAELEAAKAENKQIKSLIKSIADNPVMGFESSQAATYISILARCQLIMAIVSNSDETPTE